jgi:tRNA 2-thiouridine synthesizing protein A
MMRLFKASRQTESASAAQPHTVNLPQVGAVQVDRELDCRGDMCPRPQLLTKRTVLQEMRAREILELIVDNPSSPELVPTIMSDIGATHLGTIRAPGEWRLYIRKEG